VTLGDRIFRIDLGPEGVLVEGRPVQAELQSLPRTPVRSLLLDGASHRLVARRPGPGQWELHLGGRQLLAAVVDERTRAIREMVGASSKPTGPRPVCAPMPGLVTRVDVAAGDWVELGAGLIIVEAMKMENELRAEHAGRVRRLLIAAGSTVEKDQVLIEFEAPVVEEP
jgi:pyruvate carboxylase subunit B